MGKRYQVEQLFRYVLNSPVTDSSKGTRIVVTDKGVTGVSADVLVRDTRENMAGGEQDPLAIPVGEEPCFKGAYSVNGQIFMNFQTCMRFVSPHR